MPSEYHTSIRNQEFVVKKFMDDFTMVALYRGELDLTDDDQWIVVPGDRWVIEVYNRADTSIWLELDNDKLKDLGEMIMELTA